jgi:hypothetical protein
LFCFVYCIHHFRLFFHTDNDPQTPSANSKAVGAIASRERSLHRNPAHPCGDPAYEKHQRITNNVPPQDAGVVAWAPTACRLFDMKRAD